jgi:hypothetical protein
MADIIVRVYKKLKGRVNNERGLLLWEFNAPVRVAATSTATRLNCHHETVARSNHLGQHVTHQQMRSLPGDPLGEYCIPYPIHL